MTAIVSPIKGQSGLAAFVQRHRRQWGFPVIYLSWTWFFWLLVVWSGQSVWSFPNVAFFIIGGLSPLIAGLGMTWLTLGKDGFRDLGRRLVDVRPIRPRWWAVILLFYPILTLVVAAIGTASGTAGAPLEIISTDRLFSAGGFFALLAFSILFPFPEEIGLRGFWLDRLQERWNPLMASFILGIVWALWHVPLLWMEDYYSAATFQPEWTTFLSSIVMLAIMMTWIYNHTGRSVLAVILFHFAINFTGEVMGLSPELDTHRFVALLAATVIVSVVMVGRKDQPPPAKTG